MLVRGQQPQMTHIFRYTVVGLTALLCGGIAQAQTLELHGSGTTNPSEFFWKAMHNLEVGSKRPLRLTYRAIGSGNGITEFNAGGLNDFASADITIAQNEDEDIAHIPFAGGGIGVFVNIPELRGTEAEQEKGLFLNAQMLFEIAAGEKKVWSDLYEEMRDLMNAENTPDVDISWLQDLNQPITFVHRADRSSSSSAFVNFIDFAAEGDVAAVVEDDLTSWECDKEPGSCVAASGSGNVRDTIIATEYSIGYLSRGHSYPEEFYEVYINFRNNNMRMTNDNLERTVSNIEWPELEDGSNSILADFDGFAVVPADTTDEEEWPMTLISYVIVRNDFEGEGTEQQLLLRAFLEYVTGYCLADDCDEATFESYSAKSFLQEFLFVPVQNADWVKEGLLGMFGGFTGELITFELTSTAIVGAAESSIALRTNIRDDYVSFLLDQTTTNLESLRETVENIEIPLPGTSSNNTLAKWAIVLVVVLFGLNIFLAHKVVKLNKTVTLLVETVHVGGLKKSSEYQNIELTHNSTTGKEQIARS